MTERAPAAERDASSLSILNHASFQTPAKPLGPQKVSVKVRRGETFQQAVMRIGVSAAEANTLVKLVGQAADVVNINAGMALEAAVQPSAYRRGPARLIGFSMRTGPAKTLQVSRTFDGALRLRELEEKITEETHVAQGEMQGSLYESALRAGATPAITSEVIKLFSHKIDFSRDIKSGDQFTLVFDRKVTESGRTLEVGDLQYAEIGAKGQRTRFYRFKQAGAKTAQFFDESGKNIRGFLLRTPVDGA
ncbi:MAG: M23 family peptidase, partial [Caulobacteraceae bacterium]